MRKRKVLSKGGTREEERRESEITVHDRKQE